MNEYFLCESSLGFSIISPILTIFSPLSNPLLFLKKQRIIFDFPVYPLSFPLETSISKVNNRLFFSPKNKSFRLTNVVVFLHSKNSILFLLETNYFQVFEALDDVSIPLIRILYDSSIHPFISALVSKTHFVALLKNISYSSSSFQPVHFSPDNLFRKESLSNV
jgi:hypothetical protein